MRWLNKYRKKTLPKTPIHAAIAYCLNHWKALNYFLADGILEIGRVENWRASLRMLVVAPLRSLWSSVRTSITTFPVPARQTGHALLTHQAFGQSHTFALGTSALTVAIS